MQPPGTRRSSVEGLRHVLRQVPRRTSRASCSDVRPHRQIREPLDVHEPVTPRRLDQRPRARTGPPRSAHADRGPSCATPAPTHTATAHRPARPAATRKNTATSARTCARVMAHPHPRRSACRAGSAGSPRSTGAPCPSTTSRLGTSRSGSAAGVPGTHDRGGRTRRDERAASLTGRRDTATTTSPHPGGARDSNRHAGTPRNEPTRECRPRPVHRCAASRKLIA